MSVNEIRHSTASFPSVVKQNKSGQKSKGPAEPTVQSPPGEPQEGLLTPDEKTYFARMFPQSASDIQSYQVYSPGGKRTVVQSGTIIDRRG
jgi:hypothetical protein